MSVDFESVVDWLAGAERSRAVRAKRQRRRDRANARRQRQGVEYKERYATDPAFRETEKRRAKVRYARLTSEERLLRSARKRAKRLGLPFDLTAEYLRSIWPTDGRCPVLGFRMLWDTVDGAEVAPSLDRINREAGYVQGNVNIISGRANRLKSDAHQIELVRVIAYLQGRPWPV